MRTLGVLVLALSACSEPQTKTEPKPEVPLTAYGWVDQGEEDLVISLCPRPGPCKHQQVTGEIERGTTCDLDLAGTVRAKLDEIDSSLVLVSGTRQEGAFGWFREYECRVFAKEIVRVAPP